MLKAGHWVLGHGKDMMVFWHLKSWRVRKKKKVVKLQVVDVKDGGPNPQHPWSMHLHVPTTFSLSHRIFSLLQYLQRM
jgi:hypothetical protein